MRSTKEISLYIINDPSQEEKQMKIADNYLSGLKKAYYSNGGEETWDHFEQIKHGASKTDLEKLQEAFPAIPQGLLDLLEYVDGTYWRTYADEEIAFFFLAPT